jgi:hypothetical protein
MSDVGEMSLGAFGGRDVDPELMKWVAKEEPDWVE